MIDSKSFLNPFFFTLSFSDVKILFSIYIVLFNNLDVVVTLIKLGLFTQYVSFHFINKKWYKNFTRKIYCIKKVPLYLVSIRKQSQNHKKVSNG